MPQDETTHRGNDLALVEAALFLSPQPLTRRGLAKILGGVALAYIDGLLEDLALQYADSSRGIELAIDDGRACLRVKRPYIEQTAHLAPQQDIPRPILRTLAVIAYNHPMTQADLVRVRGNKAYTHVQELVDRGLIRPEEHGRTLLLYVTNEFLRHFGLRTIEEFRFHVSAPSEAEMSPPGEDEATSDGKTVSAGGAAESDEAPQPSLPDEEPGEDEDASEGTDPAE
jgi:segregation and condensation protein B